MTRGGRVARKLLLAVPTLLAVTFFAYLMAVSSGNHFWQIIANYANLRITLTKEQVLQLEQFYHLNQPVFEGYFLWLSSALQGNLGLTINGQPVVATITPWIVPTLELQVPAVVTSLVLGLVIGVFSAGRRGSKVDSGTSAASAVLLAVPSFWLAIFAIYVFSLKLHLLPSFGIESAYPPYWWGSPPLDALAHYILPFAVLVTVSTPIYYRLARASALETLSSDWVQALALSSVSRRRILYVHVLRNAMGPAITAFAVNMSVFLASSPGIEFAFTWPGLGLGFARAALNYDQPVMLGVILVMTVITIGVWVVSDAVQSVVDPRVGV